MIDYIDYANKVLPLYPISSTKIEFIRHNENMIFKIIDDIHNDIYVLRIHKSKIIGFSGLQHTYACLKSEMEFLDHLAKHTTLSIQEPIYTCNGELVAISMDDESHTPLYATLLKWIEGNTLDLSNDVEDEIIHTFGINVAKLHKGSMEFKPSKDFKRPAYSIEELEKALKDLEYGVEVELYDLEQYKLMTKVAAKVIDNLKALDSRSNAWGLIHADYQPGNIIVSNGSLSFIDFCLSGYGYYLFDLGSAGTIVKSEKRNIFLDGYASILPFSYEDLIYVDSLIFYDSLISYNLFIKDADNRGWIKKSAEKLCNEFYPKFLNGETVFYLF